MSTLPTKPKIKYPTRINVQKSVAAGRRTGMREQDVRKLLAGGAFGRTIPDSESRDITKGMKYDRWAKIQESIRQCDRKLSAKGITDDIWVAVSKAKAEYISALAEVSRELDESSHAPPSYLNGQGAPHAFAPREQIGNVTAVQVNIGKAQEPALATDVSTVPSTPPDP